jgi:hypothetical protein
VKRTGRRQSKWNCTGWGGVIGVNQKMHRMGFMGPNVVCFAAKKKQNTH